MKYFTVDEANALISQCDEIFTHALRLRDEAEQKAIRLRDLEGADEPDDTEITLIRSQLQFLVNGVNEWLRKIVDFGALPKGLEPALVDFPHRLDKKEVFLCWSRGEKKITHYHGLDEGFQGRQPLPKKKKTRKKKS